MVSLGVGVGGYGESGIFHPTVASFQGQRDHCLARIKEIEATISDPHVNPEWAVKAKAEYITHEQKRLAVLEHLIKQYGDRKVENGSIVVPCRPSGMSWETPVDLLLLPTKGIDGETLYWHDLDGDQFVERGGVWYTRDHLGNSPRQVASLDISYRAIQKNHPFCC
jgi:hypothetical protein